MIAWLCNSFIANAYLFQNKPDSVSKMVKVKKEYAKHKLPGATHHFNRDSPTKTIDKSPIILKTSDAAISLTRLDSFKVSLTDLPKDSNSKDIVLRNLLDSIGNELLLRGICFPYEKIKWNHINLYQEKLDREFPRLKAIKIKTRETQYWKFYVFLFLVLMIGIIRLLSIKRFNEVISSTFDLSINIKNYFEKNANHIATAIALFVVSLASLSFFVVSYLEKSKRYETDNYFLLFLYIIGSLAIFYLIKIILNLLISAIFNMTGMAYLIIFNTIFVNNFLGMILLLYTVLYIYIPGSESFTFITEMGMLTIMVAVVYRLIKNILMSQNVTKYPFIYLFLYLCAFEFFPWLVVFKLFLNSW